MLEVPGPDGYVRNYRSGLSFRRGKLRQQSSGELNANGALIFVHQVSDGRAFPLDSNPGFDLFPDFDWQHSQVHDERGAIFFIIDGLSFKFFARFQRDGETIDNFFIGTRTLKNPGCFPDELRSGSDHGNYLNSNK
jgi:hypothetical protein